jgi:hypothetical protein
MKQFCKNPKQLTINVDMTDKEVSDCFNKSFKSLHNSIIHTNSYASYLKHILGADYDTADIESIFSMLNTMKEYVYFCLLKTTPYDRIVVIDCLQKNNYFSKNTSRPGVVVKLFYTEEYNGKVAVVKTYMYDGHSQELKWSLEQNIKNEILFQNYAKTLNKTLDFISPELYAWGEIRGYKPYNDISTRFKVIYLIMEHIPFVKLKDISQISNITEIYERVYRIDKDLKSLLLHHNDLHNSNILVSNSRSPLPEICILDFGESSYGPRKEIR